MYPPLLVTTFNKPAPYLDNNLDDDTVMETFSTDQYKMLGKIKTSAISFNQPSRDHYS